MGTLEKCRSAFVETAVDDEIVIICLDSGRFFSIKGTGLAVWHMIDRGASRGQILAGLADRFDAAPEVLARDVELFLGDARRAGLIREVPE